MLRGSQLESARLRDSTQPLIALLVASESGPNRIVGVPVRIRGTTFAKRDYGSHFAVAD